MEYPANDTQFEDKTIDRVEKSGDGFAITCDGWSLYCGDNNPIKPREGMIARMYGNGLGCPVRGLFIDGKRFWYRTEAEDREHHDIQSYGADAADWLARWDAGKAVWTIEMGGIGPGYEQCIAITTAEVLRWFLARKCDAALWEDAGVWKQVRDDLQATMFKNEVINNLGLSGAQYGAAVSLASALYMKGPRVVMADPKVKYRHIQVSKNFPGAAA